MSRLDRPHLTLLAALKRDGTLTAAAESLHITQAAASQRLREAERRMGLDLTVRRGRGVILTPAGERLAEAGEELDRSVRLAEADAIWMGRRGGARLRLAQNHHDNRMIYDLVTRSAEQSGFEGGVDLIRCRGEEVERMIKAGEADIAVLPTSAALTGVDSVPVAADRLAGAVPPAHPLSKKSALQPQDFAAMPYLTYGLFPQSGWEYERFFRAADRFPGHIVMLESTEMIAAQTASGRGLSILPQASLSGTAATPVPLDGPDIGFSWQIFAKSAFLADRAALVAALRKAWPAPPGRGGSGPA